MLISDFLFIPVKLPTGNETEMLFTETVLVHTVPSVIKGLPIAFGLHSDQAINEEVQLSWEIVGDGGFVGDFSGPLQLNLAASV